MPQAEAQEERLYTGQLRKDIQVFPGQPDDSGMPTWLLFDPVSDKYFRLSEREYLMVSLLYENKLVDDFYDKSISLGSTIDRNGVFNVISFLMNNNLMMPVYGSTERRLSLQKERKEASFWSRMLQSYLFFKIPLFCPDPFISKSYGLLKTVFNKWTILSLSLIALIGYVSVAANFGRLLSAAASSLTVSGLFKYAIAIAILKAFHELAHAYTAKSFGVRVRRFGVGIMVFFPRFYTDITDSWRLPDPKARASVDAAGIIFEIIAGGFAALLWLGSPPGVINTIAYYAFAVTALNTLLVNGNPFIKYDGYYFVMDLVNIDNLQQKSLQAVNELMLRYLFGIRRSRHPILSNRAKNSFLVFFGISSFLYRIFLYTSIIVIIYFKFTKSLAIALVVLEIYILIIRPVLNQARVVMAYRSKMKAFNVLSTAIVVTAALAAFIIPMPWRMELPCEVRSDKEHILYAPSDGFLNALEMPEGSMVKPGDLVASMSNPELENGLKAKEADLKFAKAEFDLLSSSQDTLPKAAVSAKRVEALKSDVEELKRRISLLSVKSSLPGRLLFYDPDMKAPKWIRKGEPIGEVFSPETSAVIAYAKEDEIGKIKAGDKASIALQGSLSEIPAHVKSVNRIPEGAPSPSPLLSVSGGPVKTDEGPDGLVYSEPVYQLILEPERREGLDEGRSGQAFLRKPQSLAVSASNNLLEYLKRIFSF